jgi:hypothetical protein
MVSEFIRDLRSSLRKVVIFECDSIDSHFISADLVAFREAIASVERERPQNQTHNTRLMAAARVSISAHTAALRETVSTLYENLREELSGLHRLRVEAAKRRRDAQIRTSATARRRAELEANEMLHQAQLLLLQPRMEDDPYDGSHETHDLVHQLQDICSCLQYAKDPAFKLLRRKSRELVDCRDEMKTIRLVHGRSQGHFCQVVESVSAVMSQSRLMRSAPTPIPREATESVEGTRTELSVAALRSKLDSIQEERDRSLESLVAFLDDVKSASRRTPRHRHHRRN